MHKLSYLHCIYTILEGKFQLLKLLVYKKTSCADHRKWSEKEMMYCIKKKMSCTNHRRKIPRTKPYLLPAWGGQGGEVLLIHRKSFDAQSGWVTTLHSFLVWVTVVGYWPIHVQCGSHCGPYPLYGECCPIQTLVTWKQQNPAKTNIPHYQLLLYLAGSPGSCGTHKSQAIVSTYEYNYLVPGWSGLPETY